MLGHPTQPPVAVVGNITTATYPPSGASEGGEYAIFEKTLGQVTQR